MARGSSAGSSSGGPASPNIEMFGESGEINNAGKAKIRKKFFVQNIKDVPKVKVIEGYTPVSLTYNQIGGGAYEQNVEYAAQLGAQDTGVVQVLAGLTGTFEMFTNYETRPIALHPNILTLLKEYAGQVVNGVVQFAGGLIQKDGGSGLSGGEGERNPMFGVTHYKAITMTFRHTYYQRNVNASIYDRAGKIVTSLPGGFPTPKGEIDEETKEEIKRRWLMLMPALTKEGNSFRIVQEYVLLDLSGIADNLYEPTSTPGDTGNNF